MIAKLKGLLDETGVDWAVIDVSGVGYLVHCSARTLSQLGEKGEACTVYTDLQVSENDMRLLGFADGAERDWFRLLTQVQGVGSKVALAILSALSIGEVQQACSNGDAATIARAQGVGPKLATRIVTELKGKAPAMMAIGASSHQAATPLTGHGPADANPPSAAPQVAALAPSRDESAMAASAGALSALVNLGYDRIEAAEAVAEAGRDADLDEAELIKAALQTLGKNL